MVEETQEYGRPRRPNAETVSYLNGLPLDESLAAQQVRDYISHFQKTDAAESEAPDYPPLLSATHAALSSIQKELASLACEETPSLQVETLIRISCRFSVTAKRVVLQSMATYWPFLCTHRFGSHVAQTALRCVVAKCEVNLEEFDQEGKEIVEDSYGALFSSGEDAASLKDLMLQTCEELKPYASELAVHVCGTHVLRSAICILSGVEFVDAFAQPRNEDQSEWDVGALAATRRGKLKDKKKKKKKKPAPAGDGDSHSRQEVTIVKTMSTISELQSNEYGKDGKVLLRELIDGICGDKKRNDGKVSPPGELQQRTCHPSAGPLLVQIIRVLSFLDAQSKQSTTKSSHNGTESLADRRLVILPKEAQYSSGSDAEALVHKLLCWDSSIHHSETDEVNAENAQPYAGDIIYGLSGEPRGSILLETIFRCAPDSFHNEICHTGGFYIEETLREYAFHSVSNFVVQAVLNTVRSKSQVANLVKCLCGMIEDGSILKFKGQSDESPTNKRMGIVWRAMEMCVMKGSSQDQEQIIHALMRGYATISTTSSHDNLADDEGSKRKKRSKAKGLSAQECIPLLLGLKPGIGEDPDAGGAFRLVLDASGARALHHIFHFSERLRSDWVKGFARVYEQGDLVKIANDGLGSRW